MHSLCHRMVTASWFRKFIIGQESKKESLPTGPLTSESVMLQLRQAQQALQRLEQQLRPTFADDDAAKATFTHHREHLRGTK
ncbi:MAG: hypothetical protein OEU36_19910 [Gammaproteobacteria bacterium]|nr:hypothetical protein [Gammaproteobacteria bacterium]